MNLELNNNIINPVDWFNLNGSFINIFSDHKNANVKSETEVCLLCPGNLDISDLNKPTFVLENSGYVKCVKENEYDVAINSTISKFMLLTAVKFKSNYHAALSHVAYELMKIDIPYIRVGTDYFKLIQKKDRWGGKHLTLKPWKKDEIKEDHTKALLQRIYKYDDFTIKPNNIQHVPVIGNSYNLYARFPHKPSDSTNCPNTLMLISHIFGEHYNLGLQYMKLLYEDPEQILPVLALVSTERETGKTTFLNYIKMLFGENSVLINPQDLSNSFNAGYVTKNIIMIDETVIDKTTSIEKLKSLATAKTISVSQKFVQNYEVEFFGKIIICTNKEKDFMRIDQEEIRFWIRKIKPITGKKNVNIERDLFNEIPAFLNLLSQLPEVDKSNSRMVFTNEQIATEHLKAVKDESKSGLCKEIEILIEDYFNNTGHSEFEATAKDIKEKWFNNNNQVSIAYIRKVVKDEMKIEQMTMCRYYPFNNFDPITSKTGQPFKFKSKLISEKPEKVDLQEDMPF